MVCDQFKFSLNKIRFAFGNAPISSKGFIFSGTISSFSLAQGFVKEFDYSFFAIFIQLSKDSTDCKVRSVSGQNKWFIIIGSGKNWFFNDLLLEILKGFLSSNCPIELWVLFASCY